MKTRLENPSSTLLFGLGFLTIFFSVIAFFYRLNIEVFVLTLFTGFFLCFFYRRYISEYFKNLKNIWNDFEQGYKIIFTIIVFSVCLKSAGVPFVADNESYYIQTIKWLNQHGFVKGLANLHIFLAQNSGWHVLQSGLNLSFFTDRINDINTFLFVVCSFFYLSEFQKKYKKQNLHWIGFVFVFSVLLFQFVDAPSPDFPILLICPIIFYLFSEENSNKNALRTSLFLFLFLVFIKLTVAPLGLLFLFWIKKRKEFVFPIVLGVVFMGIWLLKNSIISGYPLYPFDFFALDADWLVSEKIRFFIDNLTRETGYFENKIPKTNFSFFEKLKFWVLLSGINGIMNKGILFLFAVVLFTQSLRKNKFNQIIYFVLLVHFVLVLLTSPQFRFFLPEFMFFSVLIIKDLVEFLNRKINCTKPIIILSVLFPLFFLFPVGIASLTDNSHHKIGGFKAEFFLIPYANSKYAEMEFETKQKGNLIYNSPKEKFFFYGTANGDLPCVNEVYIEYMQHHFGVIPQMRTNNLKDGFYAKSVSSDERF